MVLNRWLPAILYGDAFRSGHAAASRRASSLRRFAARSPPVDFAQREELRGRLAAGSMRDEPTQSQPDRQQRSIGEQGLG